MGPPLKLRGRPVSAIPEQILSRYATTSRFAVLRYDLAEAGVNFKSTAEARTWYEAGRRSCQAREEKRTRRKCVRWAG